MRAAIARETGRSGPGAGPWRGWRLSMAPLVPLAGLLALGSSFAQAPDAPAVPAQPAERADLASWFGAPASGLGLSLGVTRLGMRAGQGLNPGQAPQLDLGLQWRHPLDSRSGVNITTWRNLTPPDALSLVQARQPVYGAQLEMQFTGSSRSGFVADYHFIGLQLESGTRISLRRKDGRPAIYVRSRF